MFPLSDDNEPLSFPAVTIAIIGGCIAAFVWQLSLPPGAFERAFQIYGFTPIDFFTPSARGVASDAPPAWMTVFTSMFLHGGFAHIIGNLWFLWIFGDNVEGAMGKLKFTLFYLICGAAAALTQGLTDPSSAIPLIGASGAVSGVLGAYVLLYPSAMVRTVIILIVFVKIIYVPAALVLGLWFVFQVLAGATTPSDGGGVAFWAHAGGFVAGLLLTPLFKKRDVALFSPPRSRAFRVHGREDGPWGKRR